MLRKIFPYLVLAAIVGMYLSAAYLSPATTSTQLNNIALCYHGITTNETECSQYVTYFENFKNELNYIKSMGYSFVSPSQYSKYNTKKFNSRTPIATIMFDDARDSITVAADWLIENKIPFGIAVIGRRLRTFEAENGYLNWSQLKSIVDSGYCEIMSHSYNMHNFGLNYEDNQVVTAPILEGPCFLDSGDFVYINKKDTRWYWDMSFVDDTSWAFPIFGTDVTTGKPITSTIKFKAKNTFKADKLRVWACLHSPSGCGYDVNVKIDINGTVVADQTISTVKEKNRIQWPEKEFVTIEFDKAYNIEANKTYSITFTSQNSGNSAFLIYSIPDFTGNFQLSTSCENMTYEAMEKWPAKACIIIAGDNGKQVKDTIFAQYVFDDLNTNNNVINNYLSAAWTAHTTGFTENESLECLVLGGTYSDGSLGNTNIKFLPDTTFTSEVLRFKCVNHLGGKYPLVMDIYINDTKVARYSPNWGDWSWQTVNITPYKFVKGQTYNVTFKTLNKNSSGYSLLRIYNDQKDFPFPKWDSESGTWIKPSDSAFQYNVNYKVNSKEGTDIFPNNISINQLEYNWIYTSPYTGPGKPFLEFLSYKPGKSTNVDQICYPFGSYYAQKDKEDINPVFQKVLNSIHIKTGYGAWFDEINKKLIIPDQISDYDIPRYLVEGDIEEAQVLEKFNILMGLDNK